MVLGFLKMLGTASVALSGTTTSTTTSSFLSSPTARHAAATLTTSAAAAAAVVGCGPPPAAGGEPMRIRSPLIYSFPISKLEDVRVCLVVVFGCWVCWAGLIGRAGFDVPSQVSLSSASPRLLTPHYNPPHSSIHTRPRPCT